MKYLVLIATLISSINIIHSQQNHITIGKRTNVIRDRKIDSINLGTMNTVFYPIFYKIGNKKYEKTGAYGKHLYPYLNHSIKEVNNEFNKFKRNKLISHILLASSISFLSIWLYRAPNLYINPANNSLKDIYIKNNQYLFLIGYSISITSSMILNVRGDKKLINSIRFHNQSL